MLKEWLESARDRVLPLLRPYWARIREVIEPYYEQARARYQKLESRERILVQIAGALGSIFLAYNLIYSPIVGLHDGLRQRIEERQRDLAEVKRLEVRYQRLDAYLKEAQRLTVPSSKDFSLFSLVESSLTKSVGHDKIASITPASDKKLPDGLTQYSVQLKLSNLSLAQMVDALYQIRALPVPVAVDNMRIQRRSQDPHTYDVDMTCVALGKNA
jgi:type II secretory pathway component PulM